MGWSELFDLAAGHGNLVTPTLVRASGLAPSTFYDRVKREQWRSPCPRVWLPPGVAFGPTARIDAAIASVGAPVVVSGWSAAYLQGLARSAPTIVSLRMAPNRRARGGPGIDARPCTTLDWERDVAPVDGRPCTRLGRTVFDLAGATTDHRLLDLTIDARFRDELLLDDVDRLLGQTRTAPGRGRMARIRRQLRSDDSDSGFEFRARDGFVAAGLSPDVVQHPIGTRRTTRRIDLGWSYAAVGVECLGFAWHGGRAQFEADVERSNEIAEVSDWLLFGLTWPTFVRRFDAFVARVARAVERRSSIIARVGSG